MTRVMHNQAMFHTRPVVSARFRKRFLKVCRLGCTVPLRHDLLREILLVDISSEDDPSRHMGFSLIVRSHVCEHVDLSFMMLQIGSRRQGLTEPDVVARRMAQNINVNIVQFIIS